MMTDPMNDPARCTVAQRLKGTRPELEAEWSSISFLLHEISGPLTVIQGFSEVIRDETLSREEIQEYAADISKEAARLIELIVRTREQHRQLATGESQKEAQRR